MTTWSRRLSSAQQKTPGLSAKPTPTHIPDTVPTGITPDDREAVKALLQVAKVRPGFKARIAVRIGSNGSVDEIDLEIAHSPTGPTAVPVGEPRPVGSVEAAEQPPAEEIETDLGRMSGDRVIEMLTDTLVITSDIVAIFSSVGAEALWANDAFATAVSIRESDKIWLIELLDEWSKGHFEVNVLPALVQHGRWQGKLTLEPAEGELLPVSASLVAHRDPQGEIEAVSMVARDLRELNAAEERVKASETRLAALVENASDIIAVIDDGGRIAYASPGATRVLDLDDGALDGVTFLDLVHEDDRERCDFEALSEPDEEGLAPTTELRLRADDGSWRHVEVVATDLSDNPAIGGIVLNARDVTDRVEAVTRLADRAYTDPLTLLPNRMRLLDRLGQVLQDAEEHSVVALLLDVDDFRAFNEARGHAAGDELLRQVGRRLKESVSEEDLLARLGGVQFAIAMKDVEDLDEAIEAGEKLQEAVSKPYELGDDVVNVTASVGIAVSREGQTAEELLSDADSAVSAAEARGGNQVELLTAEARSNEQRRANVEKLLRRALDEEGVIQVHYQPIIDLETEQVIGGEALLRVHDDEGALLTPAAFLDAAEHSGLIGPLGNEVLAITCRQLVEWSEELGTDAPQEVSVNVSPRQLVDPAFAEGVRRTLEATELAPELLCLEITESMLIGEREAADQAVADIRDLGVRLGLDDFGAGHSSLGYLKRFPLDFVKIDRSLISGLGTDEEDMAIVRATVELAQNLGLQVVAVGVETPEQLEFLELLGCDRAQGFFFAPAIPADEFAARVQNWSG